MNKRFLFILSLVFSSMIFLSTAVFAQNGPLWSDNTTNVTSGSTYAAGKVYNFGINWTNETGGAGEIDNVTFETNLTTGSNLVNITKVNTTLYTEFYNGTTGIWNISFTQEQLAGAGTFVFKWYANDTVDQWNSTDQWVYTIGQGTTNITLFLNGTEGNSSYTRGASANITVKVNASYTVEVNLSTNFTSTYNTSGNSPLENMTNLTYAAGLYNITGFFEGDANYTSNSQTYWLTILTRANGVACTANIQCTGGYCVHSLCRSASTYCGDGYCDTGEDCSSCPGDCGECSVPSPAGPVASSVPGRAVVFIPSIAAASKASVTIEKAEGVDFTEISIKVVNKVNSVYLTIIKLDEKPTKVTEVPGKVYHYISVIKEQIEDEDISTATIKFKVEKSWLTNNSIDSATVALYRYADEAWNKLDTTEVDEDDDYVYYEAVTPGFSYFAISGGTAGFWAIINYINNYYSGTIGFWTLLDYISSYYGG